MFDTKKGKYTDEENEQIIRKVNEGIEKGIRERVILKELSDELNRGFAGVMSHARKLRKQYPEKFASKQELSTEQRLNSWTEKEEEIVIERVNHFLDQGQPLTAAITQLEKELNRTQGAVYQRIYTLRHKSPERFNRMPTPRVKHKKEWQYQRSLVQNLGGNESIDPEKTAVSLEKIPSSSPSSASLSEEKLVIQAFENRFGKLNNFTRNKLLTLMKQYGHTRVSIALFSIQEDKEFPTVIAEFLEQYLKRDSI
ncbi:hypothetical protein JOD24_000060 [Kroppenstedtia sanguinis]|uniref:Uncharacterized protein n=1 Tax=Kroppenstedtia sanguinis TaxID=1380684 RepID=A0ABW4C602_9BACL